MADRVYTETRAWQDVGGDVPCQVKLHDMGDGTHAPVVHDTAANSSLLRIEAELVAIRAILSSLQFTGGGVKVKLI